jgi:uroporphyrinogen-III decarboxylase
MQARNREAVELSAALDEYDYFLTFEDSSTQNYSPELYTRFIASEISDWQNILAKSGKHYVQHACGHLKALINAIASQKIWGVESLTPPSTGDLSIGQARAVAGPNFGIVGGIDPVTLSGLTGAEIPALIEGILAENNGGRLILSNADSCPPSVPAETLRTISTYLQTASAATELVSTSSETQAM